MNRKETKVLILKTLIVTCTVAFVYVITNYLINDVQIINKIAEFINILTPFIIGSIIAYLLCPSCNKLKNFMVKHSKMSEKTANTISILFVEIVTFFFITICVLIIAPQLISSCINIVKGLPSALNNIESLIKEDESINGFLINILGDGAISRFENLQESIVDIISKYLLPNMDNLVNKVTSSVSNITGLIFDTILGIIVSIMILLNRVDFSRQIRKFTYAVLNVKVADIIIEEIKVANKMFSGFFIGKIIDSLIVGVISFIGLSILKMPYAVLISIIIGITNIVPVFGPFIGAVPGFIFIFAVSPIKSLWFLIFIVILQQIDGNIIGPKCIGDATGLNTFWVLLAIILFGGLWGVVGMLVGVPLMAVIHDIVTKIVNNKLSKKDIDKNLYEE